MHLSGLDVIGSTAGSLARLIQDRESELWEGNRIVAESTEEVSHVAYPTKLYKSLIST